MHDRRMNESLLCHPFRNSSLKSELFYMSPARMLSEFIVPRGEMALRGSKWKYQKGTKLKLLRSELTCSHDSSFFFFFLKKLK